MSKGTGGFQSIIYGYKVSQPLSWRSVEDASTLNACKWISGPWTEESLEILSEQRKFPHPQRTVLPPFWLDGTHGNLSKAIRLPCRALMPRVWNSDRQPKHQLYRGTTACWRREGIIVQGSLHILHTVGFPLVPTEGLSQPWETGAILGIGSFCARLVP